VGLVESPENLGEFAPVMPRQSLPIDPVLPEVCRTLRQQPGLVLRAPTGAGKTTRVPPALLDDGLARTGRIVMLEPRRLAARAAAKRMADERGCRLGDEIGYQVRFDRCSSVRTQILVVTPGILLRHLHDDPFLGKTSVVIFDEFHERSLENDLALGIVRLVQQTVRPDLKMVVMSATLQVEAVAAYLGNVPIITSEGRTFPVAIHHKGKSPQQPWPAAIEAAVARLLKETPGDLLVFLPGLQEIRQTARHLAPLAEQEHLAVLPLYGDLPPEQQDAALLPQERRKIVLATNVAETSVTVEDVTGVIDTGLSRQLIFDPQVGLDRLQLTHISRASADQRAGRAGRTQPGVCIRLWSEAAHRTRPEQTEPEIRRVDLAGAVLNLLCLGEKDVTHFHWLDEPPAATVDQSLSLLTLLGAIHANDVSPLGRTLACLPLHPRLARLLLDGQRWGNAGQAAMAAALLSEKDPFEREERARQGQAPPTRSDVLERVEALEAFERQGLLTSRLGTLHRQVAKTVLRARDQLLRSLREETRKLSLPGEKIANADEALLRSLLAAFPDRLARRRGPGSQQGLMVGNRGVRLAPSSGVNEGELFLCIDVDNRPLEAWVRLASMVQRDWLPEELLRNSIEVAFDAASEKVVARKRLYFADLLLEDGTAALPSDTQVSQVLSAAASERLDAVLPPEESPAGLFRLRVRWLREWLPELQLPKFDDADMKEMLPWLCPGCRSFADLRKADWLHAMHGKLTHHQRQAVEREAPERLPVPSGSRIALKYELGRPPVLAVRIQEVFGLADTPRVAGGRVKVLLHLLAPNYRPQQVTDDLASFWANTYAVVRKELRARYPKHAWPEDPWNAPPERRPRRPNH
jgi:ATP-dependent helicase HrpB